MLMGVLLGLRGQQGGLTVVTPIMASRVTSSASSASVIALAARRARGQDEVAHIGVGIMHADLHPIGDHGAELLQHGARLFHHPRPVLLVLVPVRRQAQHRPRIAGAEGADHDIVQLVGVLMHDQLGAVIHGDAQLLAGGGAVREQALLIGGIDPGTGDDLGPQGGRAGIQDLDLAAMLIGGDQPGLGQKLAQRDFEDCIVTRRAFVLGGAGMVVIVVVVRHGALSSQARSSQGSYISIWSSSSGPPA